MGIRFSSFFSPWILPPADDLPTDKDYLPPNGYTSDSEGSLEPVELDSDFQK